MAKDPAFLFYSNDFLTGTLTLSFDDRGKYITILSLMHQQGRLKEESICFVVGSVSVQLKSKFQVDEEGFWYNERLENETKKRNAYTESRRSNGSKGGRKKNKDNHMDKHMQNHMDTHIEDVNTIVFNNNKEQVIPTFEKVWEVFQRQGGTKEMAESFFNKHQATEWKINNTPIAKWEFLSNNFIASWNRNEQERKNRKTGNQIEFDPTKVKIKLK